MLSPVLYFATSALSVSVAPTFIIDSVLTTSGTTTSTLVATPTGGTGSYTYAWTVLSQAGAGTMSISSPTAASTTIAYTGLTYTGSYVAGTVRITVTDTLGQTAFTNVDIEIMQDGLGSGEIP